MLCLESKLEIFSLLVLLITAGAIAGLTAGLFGNGGGFAIVPALVLLFSVLEFQSENLIFDGTKFVIDGVPTPFDFSVWMIPASLMDAQLGKGCNDPAALNYDPTANTTGDCDFGTCAGCTDTTACNYDANATIEDGSCLEFDECGQCGGDGIPEGACDCAGNIDLGCGCGLAGPSGCDETCGSTAEFDDCGECGGDNSSCSGCTDSLAFNYDVNATVEDGSFISCLLYTSPSPRD